MNQVLYIAIILFVLTITYQMCHPLLWLLLLYIMMYMIFLSITHNHKYALLLMFLITTLLCIFSYCLNNWTGSEPEGVEGFESASSSSSKKKPLSDMESFSNEIKKIVEDVGQFQQQMKSAVPKQNEAMEVQDPVPRINRNIAASYSKDDDSLNIADMDQIRDGDDSDDEGTMTQKKRTSRKSTKQMTPAEAQRETFKLINTVQQLEQTMQAMSPTIEQGKQIISMLGSLAPSLQSVA